MQAQTFWTAGKSKTNNLKTKCEKKEKKWTAVMHGIVKRWGLAQSEIKNLGFVHHLSLQHPEALFFRPSPSTPRLSRLSSLLGRFLYENPPIGSQTPLSDTIHCTRADMKSVLTSGCPVILFFLRGGTRHSNARRRSCDQIKVGEEPGGADFDVLVRGLVGFKFLSRCFALRHPLGIWT